MNEENWNIGIWCVRDSSQGLAERLADWLGGMIYLPAATQKYTTQKDTFREVFSDRDGWIFIGATGIAVRFISGLPQSKLTDPCVVVLDEAARFAIPLLGGHEGGGNRLAYAISQMTGAIPTVTTATEALKPFTVGIGCRKGVSEGQIEAAVRAASIDPCSIREVATVDLKAAEAGLLAFCETWDLPIRIFSAADLAARPFVTKESAWVQQNVGLAGVCEPCALLASVRGRLVVPKMSLNGVTVAVVKDTPIWGEIE